MSPELFNIERIAETKEYILYGRGACVAMVHGIFLGSTGYMTETGFACLIWRDGRRWLVSKGGEAEAASEQVEEIQRFSADLKKVLQPPINAD